MGLEYNFWDDFTYKQLTINCRQKDDPALGLMLNRIRIACPTVEDIKLLQSLVIKKKPNTDKITNAVDFYVEKFLEYPKILTLFPISSSADLFNSLVSEKLQIDSINTEAIDTHPNERPKYFEPNFKNPRHLKAKKRKTAHTAGLEQTLNLGINSRVILKRNIDLDKGLCNGALGTVKSLNFINNQQVISIKVLFDNGIVHTIEKINADYEYQKNIYVSRSQFPLSVLFDLGSDIFEDGMAYVALSRARNIKTIFLIEFEPSSIRCKNECVVEYNRLIRKYIPNGQIYSQWNVLPNQYATIKKTKDFAIPLISNFEKQLAKHYKIKKFQETN